MLTNPMRKYLENPAEYKKGVQAVYNRRLREYATQTLKDLALLAEKLPEKQQAKIFNKENTGPFFRELFKLSTKEADFVKRRKRVISLWHAILSNISPTYDLKLVSREVSRALTLGIDNRLKAIFYATLFRES